MPFPVSKDYVTEDRVVIGNRIVCSACKLPNGEVILGIRHWDDSMHRAFAIIKDTQKYAETGPSHKAKQGFIDKYGVFHTRTEAWKIAVAAGQIIRLVPGDDKDGGTLYSENLY